MVKFLSDNADVLRTKLRTLYNLRLSAASAVALISARQTLVLVAQNAFSVASKGPCFFDGLVSNVCCIQLLVIWQSYDNVINCIMTKTMLS